MRRDSSLRLVVISVFFSAPCVFGFSPWPWKNINRLQTYKMAGEEDRSSSLTSLTVPELKELCRERKLRVGGRKAELIDRIVEHDASGATQITQFSPTQLSRSGLEPLPPPVQTTQNHGYTFRGRQGDNEGLVDRMPSTLLAIDGLLEQRNNARLAGDFDSADECREKLRQIHGVYVDDNTREWNAAMQQQNRKQERKERKQLALRGSDYHRSEDDTVPLAHLSEDDVVSLLDRRCLARTAGDYATADAIKAELSNEFGIEVQDRTREWRADGNVDAWRSSPRQHFGSKGHDYRRASDDHSGELGSRSHSNDRRFGAAEIRHSEIDIEVARSPDTEEEEQILASGDEEVVCLLSERDIDTLLADRLQAKIRRDFERADAIRSDLRLNGVDVDDRAKLWRADGHTFASLRFAAGRRSRQLASSTSEGSSDRWTGTRRVAGDFSGRRHDYIRSPDDASDNGDDQQIDALLSERLAAKMSRDFATADSIQNVLSEKHGVEVNDVKREWRADGAGRDAWGSQKRRQTQLGSSNASRKRQRYEGQRYDTNRESGGRESGGYRGLSSRKDLQGW